MPKKKDETAAVLERFERGLRRALNTPPEAPRKRTKRKKKAQR